MQLWLKKFRFPVLPSEYHVTSSRGIETVNINALGEIGLAGGRSLKTVTFSSFFPKRYDSGYCEYSNLKSPQKCVKEVERIKNGGPVKVIITGTPVNFKCRVESFEWSEQDGTGDIYFSITLKEHRKVSAGQSKVVTLEQQTPAPEAEAPQREAAQSPPKTYTVQRGDCLSSIARKLTGSADWRPLYEANREAIGSNPNKIADGLVLTIPG